MNFDLKKLRAFHLVAKHGTLGRAASQLSVSIPAVSVQIRHLEKELGTALFHRVGKRLILTAQGDVFRVGVETVFASLDNAVQSISQTKTSLARVSIAIGNDLAKYFSRAISEYAQAHPIVDLSMHINNSPEVMAHVLSGDVDLGVGYFSRVPKELDKRILRKSGFSLVCHADHPLARLRHPNLSEIAKHRLITLSPHTSLGGRVALTFAKANIELSGKIEAGSCQTSEALAEQGLGAAIIHTVCIDHRRPKTTAVADVSQYFGTVDVAVIHRKSHRLGAVHTDFIQALSHR
jgi:DNA-binding transcriptional LysR family regulator